TYPDGTPVAMVAALDEFGSEKAPPRPFFRNMVAAKSDEWPPAIAALLKANDYDAAKALELAGSGIKSQLQESIIDTVAPPLSHLESSKRETGNPRSGRAGTTGGGGRPGCWAGRILSRRSPQAVGWSRPPG